jgi:hypothetical protein
MHIARTGTIAHAAVVTRGGRANQREQGRVADQIKP